MATSAANLEQPVLEPLPGNSDAKQMLSVRRPPTLHLQSMGAYEAARTCGGGEGTERESLLDFVGIRGTPEPREPEQSMGATDRLAGRSGGGRGGVPGAIWDMRP